MESLKLSFESVMPVFLLMMIGYFIKRIGLADKKTFDTMNSLVFKVFLPTLLFYNIYKTEDGQVFDSKLVIFTIVGVVAIFLIGSVVVRFLTKDNSKRGVMLQGFFRSNFAILGLPLIGYLCGEGSGGLASLMVAIVVPLFNVLAVISLEMFRGGNVNFKKILIGIITNPLIVACILGFVFFILDIKLPKVIESAVGDVAGLATPLAIIILGASFTFKDLKGYWRENIIVVSARLIIIPLIMLTIAALLGFTGEAFACLLVAFGAPLAVSSFSMAQQMGGDETLAGQLIVISSVACIGTLFIWIYIFSSLGIIG